jgi:hypothetical protein
MFFDHPLTRLATLATLSPKGARAGFRCVWLRLRRGVLLSMSLFSASDKRLQHRARRGFTEITEKAKRVLGFFSVPSVKPPRSPC